MALASQLQQAESDVRFFINDDAVNAKYRSARVIAKLGEAWGKVLGDINVALQPASRLYLTYDISVNTTDTQYLLPANVESIVEVALLSSDLTKTVGYMPAFWQNDVRGFNWRTVGQWFILDNAFTVASTLRITFIPSAMDYMQSSAVTESAFNASDLNSFKLDVTPDVGSFDPRPNAYVGGFFRLHTGPAQTGYAAFPWQERFITGYALNGTSSQAIIQLNKDFDINFAAAAGTYGYEIVPMPHADLMTLASYEAARSICSVEGRGDRQRAIMNEYEILKTEARRKYGAANRAAQNSAPSKIDQKNIGDRRYGFETRRTLGP